MAIEYEVRFLEIDKAAMIKKLLDMGATDQGEDMLEEAIYGKEEWLGHGKFVRIRKRKDTIFMAYKHHEAMTVDGTIEHEITISNMDTAGEILEACGLFMARRQQKLRHTFTLGNITVDIDTWPRVPAYMEIEGEDEASIRPFAEQLGLDWKNVVFENASKVLKKHYNIDTATLKEFLF